MSVKSKRSRYRESSASEREQFEDEKIYRKKIGKSKYRSTSVEPETKAARMEQSYDDFDVLGCEDLLQTHELQNEQKKRKHNDEYKKRQETNNDRRSSKGTRKKSRETDEENTNFRDERRRHRNSGEERMNDTSDEHKRNHDYEDERKRSYKDERRKHRNAEEERISSSRNERRKYRNDEEVKTIHSNSDRRKHRNDEKEKHNSLRDEHRKNRDYNTEQGVINKEDRKEHKHYNDKKTSNSKNEDNEYQYDHMRSHSDKHKRHRENNEKNAIDSSQKIGKEKEIDEEEHGEVEKEKGIFSKCDQRRYKDYEKENVSNRKEEIKCKESFKEQERYSKTEKRRLKGHRTRDSRDRLKKRRSRGNSSDMCTEDYRRSPNSKYFSEHRNIKVNEKRRKEISEEIIMSRYWDDVKEKKDERYKQSYKDEEEVEIGERFYGDQSKKNSENSTAKSVEEIPKSQKRTVDLLTSKTGGAYIPPAKLKLMQAEITDKSGAAYQRIAWEALKKSIHGYINKVNTSNIGLITRDLLRENIVRGRGLLARSMIQAQAASPTFTGVYAALTAVINSKFPNIGELILKRLAIQFKRGFRRNDKPLCISSVAFIAHLVNQRVAHEILALEILTLLVDTPTDDSIEVAIAFLKECGMRLTEVSKKGIEAIFEMLRNILHEGQLDKRVQYMIEVMFQVRKDGFKDYEAVKEELDLVEEENQFTHLVTLDDATDSQDILNVFKFDPEYTANEEKYKELIKEILDTDSSSSGESGDEEDDENSSGEESEAAVDESKEGVIIDNTETNLTALRRTIYLTIHSSLDFEECAHKLMKMQLKPGQEIELCHMFLDCCAEMRTYEKFFGLLAGRFCAINKIYVGPFEKIFKDSYDTIHRLDTNKLRNVSKFFAHLLFTDAISWEVLSCIKLNEEDTTSSSRIFIKILFQELCEYMGLAKLNQRVKDPTLQEAFAGLFPRDDPKNTRFAINFFTSIGLGGLTNDLREHLKSRPKPVPAPPDVKEEDGDSSSSESSSASSSSSSDSSSSDSSD